ncbi:MAG: hypothetical protein H6Q58_1887 [Firmicutes bacterium]|nr:hypothetical protein [Bacillota bacterium]
MGRMSSWFHPNYNAAAALSLKIFNADCADIPTLISVFSSEVVFKDACTRNLAAGEFLSLRTVHHLLFLFNAILCIKKTRPKSWGEYDRDSTQVNESVACQHAIKSLSQNHLTPIMRIYLLLFQYSAPRWFSRMLARETLQPVSSPLLVQSIIYSSSSMP